MLYEFVVKRLVIAPLQVVQLAKGEIMSLGRRVNKRGGWAKVPVERRELLNLGSARTFDGEDEL